MTVSEWADRYRIMGKEETSFPGPWRTDRVPYLRDIMDAFTKDGIETIVFLKSTQVGATEAGINIICYTIDQDPSRLLYLMPDDDVAKDFSADRLQKALARCDVLKGKYNPSDSKNSVLRFSGGFIRLSGAQSPAKLASWAVPKLFLDEVDKYPKWAGREASPLKLAEERTKNWPNRKIFLASTPTLEDGAIYQAYKAADVHYKFYIQCPKCGEWQQLKFDNLIIPNLKKNKKIDPSTVRETAYYQCENPECQHHITDAEKIEQLKGGKWCIDGPKPEGKPKKVAYSINALYSPWVTFGKFAEEYVRSKDDPADYMNFVNSWLGQPYKPNLEIIPTSKITTQKTALHEDIVPKWARLLTGGVDVQKGYMYWTIRAWGPYMTSQQVCSGRAMTWGDLQRVMDNWWPIEDTDKKVQVALYCIDSGYRQDEVYEYCARNYPVCIPIKGSSRPMDRYYRMSILSDKSLSGQPMYLYVLDTDKYKNLMFSRINRPITEKGSWMVNADVTPEYCEQICSETKVLTTKNGMQIATWVPISEHKPNHWLDCEVYALAAADVMNVKTITDDNTQDNNEYGTAGKVDPEKMIPTGENFFDFKENIG